jgi:hypothetical protein
MRSKQACHVQIRKHLLFLQQGPIIPAMDTNQGNQIQSLGGKARSERLSPEAKSAIAQEAAEARWNKVAEENGVLRLPRATHQGDLPIGNIRIQCAVLEDGTRVITQRGMFVALGMNKNPSRGQSNAIDNRPGFLSANNLNQFISDELRRSWNPIPFRVPKGSGGYKGNIAFGYRAEILPLVCHAYLDAAEAGKLKQTQGHIAKACKILNRGLGVVGIVALVDEATGYQEIRDRLALQEILQKYISGALFEWTKTFPLEFYKEIFRLKGWTWNNGKMSRIIGAITKDLVYSRLAPGVLEELQLKNPPNESGNRKYRHHQWLTRDVGHPALSRRLYELIGMARPYNPGEWERYYNLVQRTFPKLNSNLLLPYPEESEA